MKPCFYVRLRPEIHVFKYVLYADCLQKLSFGTQIQCFKYVLYAERSNSCEIDTRKHRFMSPLDKFLSFQPCKIYCRQTYSYMETVKKETSILSGNTFGDFHLSVIAIIWHSIYTPNDKIFGGYIKEDSRIFVSQFAGQFLMWTALQNCRFFIYIPPVKIPRQ